MGSTTAAQGPTGAKRGTLFNPLQHLPGGFSATQRRGSNSIHYFMLLFPAISLLPVVHHGRCELGEMGTLIKRCLGPGPLKLLSCYIWHPIRYPIHTVLLCFRALLNRPC
jgi:hypothetical protein